MNIKSISIIKIEEVMYSGNIVIKDLLENNEFIINESNIANTNLVNCHLDNSTITIVNSSLFSGSAYLTLNSVKWPSTEVINCNRDIFRLLKLVNDKQGNIIEANKFYSAEMKAYKKELKDKNNKSLWQDRVIFWLNEKVSNFSQSWILPLGWFFTIGLILYIFSQININQFHELIGFGTFIIFLIIFTLLFLSEICNFKINKLFWCSFVTSISSFIYFLNLSYLKDFVIFINPFNPFSNSIDEYRPSIWIIFKALSAFIIYQFIISLRRQTRR